MDDFREWLSDNLRYFMLGGAILLIVVVLFFGIRALMGNKKGDSDKGGEQETVTTEQDQENVPSSPANDGETDEKKDDDANPMETASAEITALIESYYKALGEKDIATLKTLEDNFPASDESKITNAKDYIEGYEVDEVYTKKGLTEDSYVVYVSFCFICQGVDTKVPALSQFYVFKDSDGEWKIDGSANDDTEISEYTVELQMDEDVQELISERQQANQDAQDSDPELAAFLAGLGEDSTDTPTPTPTPLPTATPTPTPTGPVMVANTYANVRASAGGDEILGTLDLGAEVIKTGEDGEWIQIDFNGQVGYVYYTLLDEQTE